METATGPLSGGFDVDFYELLGKQVRLRSEPHARGREEVEPRMSSGPRMQLGHKSETGQTALRMKTS